MKTFHEAPNSCFERVQQITDGDYCLVHLYDENEQYKEHFDNAVRKGREVILDNSIFELGTAFDSQDYLQKIKELNPTWYIIPDALEDCDQTLQNFWSWQEAEGLELDRTYTGGFVKPKSIGVVQGKTWDEMVQSYHERVHEADMVAFSFDLSHYTEMANEEAEDTHHEFKKEYLWMIGRQLFIKRMINEKIMNPDMQHHLLGCGLPQEYQAYKNNKMIYSVDTSNPVIFGLNKIKYNNIGMNHKISTKLFTLINSEVNDEQWECIEYNIKKFKEWTG